MKKLCEITIVTVLLFVVSSVASAQVTYSYSVNGHQYQVVEKPNISWIAAKSEAALLQLGGSLCPGYLATPTSQGEDGFIRSKFGMPLLHTKWLGGIQTVPNDGDWTWITGEPWSYENWNAGEPNNYSYYRPLLGGTIYEDALTYRNNPSDGWNDAPKEWNEYGTGGYVVEYDCFQVAIDIKPGSYPNCFNVNGVGVIPVAILGSADLNVNHIDPLTLSFEGMAVRIRGNNGPQCSIQDVSGDSIDDLVCQFADDPSQWVPGQTSAAVTGRLYDGRAFKGADSICVENKNL